MTKYFRYIIFSIITLLSLSTFFLHFSPSEILSFQERELASVPNDDFYTDKVQAIFNKRCVVCHSCFNSPCQLNLGSYEGVSRGAYKEGVYKLERVFRTEPTRLFIDEKTDKDWHKRGFFPVTNTVTEGGVETSLLSSILKKKNNLEFDHVNYETEGENYCPEVIVENRKRYNSKNFGPRIIKRTLNKYFERKPWGGMPYGFPKLEDNEIATLNDWILSGANGPEDQNGVHKLTYDFSIYSKKVSERIRAFEKLLNGRSNKAKLSSRYIYEHLFLAHIYFEDIKTKSHSFFRLTRSRTEFGDVDEIATDRPFYSPGTKKFYYRLVPIKEAIVHKTHITFAFSYKVLDRFKELFYEKEWGINNINLPEYDEQKSANPFVTFQQIPARSRYQFMLDNAHFIVMSFIRGPVCRGQVALNVIDDNFWVFFIDPDSDPAITNPNFLKKNGKYLTPPASDGGKFIGFSDFYKNQEKYRKNRYQEYENRKQGPLNLRDIWDGGSQAYTGAFLTIMRHFDSASVVRGHVGSTPKTMWALDYPTFEDIFYNLVAGYDVFDSFPHHLKSRLYMETSRINSQDLFLSFLPKKDRTKYRGLFNKNTVDDSSSRFDDFVYKNFPEYLTDYNAHKKMKYRYPFLAENIETTIVYEENLEDLEKPSSKDQFIQKLHRNFSFLKGKDEINRDKNLRTQVSDELFRNISNVNGKFLKQFPDITFVRVKSAQEDKFFTLIRNKEHYNVNYLFDEEDRRWVEKDTLSVFKGFVGSYPNLFFEIEESELANYIENITNLDGEEKSFEELFKKYGVSRFNENFWNKYDIIDEAFKKQSYIEYGIFDLNRYESR